MYIQDIFNPNQKKKLKGNKLVDNSKNLNSVSVAFLFEPKERLWKKIQIWKQISNQSNFILLEGGE